MKKLAVFALDHNYITGKIPSTIAQIVNLRYFLVSNNFITGTLPNWIYQLKIMIGINLNFNQITGEIKDIFTENYYLEEFRIGFNFISGTIPSSFAFLNVIDIIQLSNNSLFGNIPDSFSRLYSLDAIYLDGNSFTSTLPSTFSNLKLLSHLYLSDNYFTGTIPKSYQSLTNLSIFFLSKNKLSGSLDHVFNARIQKYVQTIEVSNNHFSSTLPYELFNLEKLKTFSAVSNCFTGSIPSDTICKSKTLECLNLDGLQSSATCKKYIFTKSFSTSYFIRNPIKDGIPKCLFNMSNIRVLHLSGNSLTGSLSSEMPLTTSLVDLSLSNNILTGSIPLRIQKRQWLNLDLSYNRFNGFLTSDFGLKPLNLTFIYTIIQSFNVIVNSFNIKTGAINYIVSNNSITNIITNYYTLNNNRISGKIPSFFQKSKVDTDISILNGNYFTCHLDRKNLPKSDSYESSYDCGSNQFNISYYIWVICTIFLMVLGIVAYYYKDNWYKYSTIKKLISLIYEMMNMSTDPKILNVASLKSYKQYFGIYDLLCTFATYLAVIAMFIILPIYIGLSLLYGTHTYEYAWICSGLYLSGVIPAGVLFAIYLLNIIIIRYIYIKYFDKHKLYYVDILNLESVKTTDINMIEMNQNSDNSNKNRNTISDSIDNNIINRETDLNRFSSLLREGSSISSEFNISNQSKEKVIKLATVNNFRTIILYMFVLTVNCIIVVGVNILFVYIDLYQSNSLLIMAQILLAIFDIIWNNTFLPLLIKVSACYFWNVSFTSEELDLSRIWSRLILLLIFIMILNSVFFPCFTVLLVSPERLYNIIVPYKAVTSIYVYDGECQLYINGLCMIYLNKVGYTSYDPPFVYSFQCSNDFVVYFAPSIIYSCFITTFGYPLQIMLLIYVFRYASKKSWIYKTLDFLYPSNIYKPIIPTTVSMHQDDQLGDLRFHYLFSRLTEKKCDLFECSFELIYLIIMVGNLLTFGMMYPLLAPVYLIAIYSTKYSSKILIGCFISRAYDKSMYHCIDSLDHEFHGVANRYVIRYAFWMIIILSCIFYSFFLIDMAGDQVGFQQAYWIFIAMPLSPLFIYRIEKIIKHSLSSILFRFKFKDNNMHQQDNIEMVAQSAIHS